MLSRRCCRNSKGFYSNTVILERSAASLHLLVALLSIFASARPRSTDCLTSATRINGRLSANSRNVCSPSKRKLRPTLLFIFDEVSMIGRRLMGKIDSRCEQATATCIPIVTATLGGKSCILVGDPAQCPPIGDEVFYSCDTHPDTPALSPRGVFCPTEVSSYTIRFKKVIILQHCHRIHQLAGDNLSADDISYNVRGQQFLEIMTRLRDCLWTEEDYYTLCKRKLSQLSFSARSSFADAPCIMEFRKEREDDADEAPAVTRTTADSCMPWQKSLVCLSRKFMRSTKAWRKMKLPLVRRRTFRRTPFCFGDL